MILVVIAFLAGSSITAGVMHLSHKETLRRTKADFLSEVIFRADVAYQKGFQHGYANKKRKPANTTIEETLILAR